MNITPPNPSRRHFLTLAALWCRALKAAQAHAHSTAATSAIAYKFTFLKELERSRLMELADVLIPADDRSGGAKGARVDEYIDFVLTHAAPALQKCWRDGLRWMTIAKLPRAAANEFEPKSREDQFFVLLKAAAVEGFYTSQEGISKELGYQGLGFLRAFAGCTHETHMAPEGFRPRLRARGRA